MACAVFGRTFAAPALAALTGTTSELRILVERGFLRWGESELVFQSQVGSTYQIQVGGKYNRPADTVVVGTIGLWVYSAPDNDAT